MWKLLKNEQIRSLKLKKIYIQSKKYIHRIRFILGWIQENISKLEDIQNKLHILKHKGRHDWKTVMSRAYHELGRAVCQDVCWGQLINLMAEGKDQGPLIFRVTALVFLKAANSSGTQTKASVYWNSGLLWAEQRLARLHLNSHSYWPFFQSIVPLVWHLLLLLWQISGSTCFHATLKS